MSFILAPLLLLTTAGHLTISECPDEAKTFVEAKLSERIQAGEHIIIVCRDDRVFVSSERGKRHINRAGISDDVLGSAILVAVSRQGEEERVDPPSSEPASVATARSKAPGGPPTGPRPGVRGYFLQSIGMMATLPSAGQASYREFNGCYITKGPECTDTAPVVMGVGQRQVPAPFRPTLLDFELGMVIRERFRLGAAFGGPFEATGYFGVDVAHVLASRPDAFGAFTLWLGGGYASLIDVLSFSQVVGPLATLRATFEYKSGYFIIRPELFARLHFVTQHTEPDWEGGYNERNFSPAVPTVQLGLKLGIGVNWPR